MHQAKDVITLGRQTPSGSRSNDQTDLNSPGNNNSWLLSSSTSLNHRKASSSSSTSSEVGIFHTIFTKLRDWVSSKPPLPLRDPSTEPDSPDGGARIHSGDVSSDCNGRNTIVPMTCCDGVATDDEFYAIEKRPSCCQLAVTVATSMSLSCGRVVNQTMRYGSTAAIHCDAVLDQKSSNIYATWPTGSNKRCMQSKKPFYSIN